MCWLYFSFVPSALISLHYFIPALGKVGGWKVQQGDPLLTGAKDETLLLGLLSNFSSHGEGVLHNWAPCPHLQASISTKTCILAWGDVVRVQWVFPWAGS